MNREFIMYFLKKRDIDKKNKQQLQEIIQLIQNTPEWLESVKHQAEERGIGLDEMLRINAMYTLESDKKNEQQ